MFKFLLNNQKWIVSYIKSCLTVNARTKRHRFFKEMAETIGTKTDAQCKSRYQKKEFRMLDGLELPPKLLKKYKKLKSNKNQKKFEYKFDSDNDEMLSVATKSMDDIMSNISFKSSTEMEKVDESFLAPLRRGDLASDQKEMFLPILHIDEKEEDDPRVGESDTFPSMLKNLNVSFRGFTGLSMMPEDNSATLI